MFDHAHLLILCRNLTRGWLGGCRIVRLLSCTMGKMRCSRVFEGYCERAVVNAAVARFAQRVQIFLPNMFHGAVARFAQRVQIFLPNLFHICFRCRQCSPPYLHPCSEAASQFVSGSEAFSIFHTLAFIDISCLCGSPSFKRLLRNSGFG
jgi:hypothetical protein